MKVPEEINLAWTDENGNLKIKPEDFPISQNIQKLEDKLNQIIRYLSENEKKGGSK